MVVVLLQGCYLYAMDTTTTQLVAKDLHPVPVRTDPPVVQPLAWGATIKVFAFVPRQCRRDLATTTDTTHGKKLALGTFLGEANDGYSLLIGAALTPFMIPISGLIAGIELNRHHDTVTRTTKVTANGVEPCPVIGTRSVMLQLASGGSQMLVTARDGTTSFELPASEPDQGTVAVSTTGSAVVAIDYYRTAATCAAARNALLARANAITGYRAPMLEHIPRCGTLFADSDRAADHVWDLAIGAAAAAARGVCRPAYEAEEGVRNLDPTLHAAVYGHAELVACLAKETARRRNVTDCMQTRADKMRAAQAIANPQQRGDALRKIPQCQPGE